MRWPLRNQILLPLAGVTVVAVVVVSVLSAVLATRNTEARIVRQLQNIADVVRPATFPLTDAVLQQARGLSGAELVVTDAADRVRATSLSGLTSLPLPLAHRTQDENDRDAELERGLGASITVNGERFFHRAIDSPPRATVGDSLRIHILYPEQVWRENRWQAAMPPLVVGSVVSVVLIAASYLLAQRVSLPIRQVRARVAQIAEGDFRPLALPERDDELRDLVLSINAMAEKLRQLTQTLQRTERLALLGQLGGGLAHHLRNDITGAKMAVQLHQRQCQDADRQSLEVALRQLSLTEEHLRQFLDVGKPREPRRVACDLRQIVQELLRLLEPTVRHRKIDVRLEGLDAAWPLVADPEQLRQLLLNLVLNAIDAVESGGWIKIDVTALAERRSLRVHVTDSGPGPASSIREHLFEPFVTGKPEGIGLGLAAARQIAETHGGSIELLASSPTCFEVTLPVSS